MMINAWHLLWIVPTSIVVLASLALTTAAIVTAVKENKRK